MSREILLSQEDLLRVTVYDPETGVFSWRIARRNVAVGGIIGSFNRDGYIQARILNVQCKLHRAAFLYMTGRWPTCQVDHINRNPSDNRWSNLREAGRSENNFNRIRYPNSGFKGVYPSGKKWIARICLKGGKYVTVGTFNTAEEAALARDNRLKIYHGEFANLTFGEHDETII